MLPSVSPNLRLPTAGTGPVRPTRDASGAATSRWSGGRVDGVAGGGLQRRASVALGSRPRRGRPSDPQRPTAAGRAARARLARIISIRRPATSPPATHDPVLRPSDAPTRHFAGRSGRPPPAVGVDPPISSPRPYHLEAARRLAARHRGVRWAPLNTSAAQITLEAGSAAVKCPSPESRRRPPRQVRRPNRRSDRSQRHHISRGDLRAPF